MQKVVKIPFLGMNQDDPDANLKRGFYRRAENLLPPDTSSGYILENIPSTTLRDNGSLPVGTNVCKGAFEDRTNNKIIYFIHNSNNNHGIWEFDPDDNTHTLILQDALLGLTNRVHSAGVIRNLLYWVEEGDIVRHLDRTNPPSGTIYEKKLALNRPYPQLPPTVSKATDAAYAINNVSADSWQFCVRLIYKNNEYSRLSPLSKLAQAEMKPQVDLATNNRINITATLDSQIITEAEKIQFIYTKNNSGIFYLFHEVAITGAGPYAIAFYNDKFNEVLPDADVILSNNIPLESSNLCVKDDKVFLTNDLVGYEDEGSSTLGLSVSNSASVTVGLKMHLPLTTYKYGVVYFDDYGNTNGVINETSIKIPNYFSTTGVPSARPRVVWTLGGTPPSWAKYYSIVRSSNISIQNYFTCLSQVLFYKRELLDSTRASSEQLDDGKLFYDSKQNGWTDPIYLKIPTNIPVALDSTWRVRVLTNIDGGTVIDRAITDVVGDKIIVEDNMGITNWGSGSVNTLLDIMVYLPKKTPEIIYHEIGDRYATSGGAFTTTSATHDGDQFLLQYHQSFEPFEGGNFASGYQNVDADDKSKIVLRNMYAPTPTLASNTIEVEGQTERGEELSDKFSGFDAIEKKIKSLTTISTITKLYTPDYTKIASDIGRSYPVIRNKQQVEDYNSISFSNPFVAGTKINGTNRFDPLNSYTVPNDRTRIKKLVPVNASTVMLAISERNTTSLYVGDAFINTADGNEILTKTDGVLTKQGDRLLSGGYGTIHPESVVEHNGSVYWFDAHRGEVLRYNQAGLVPIGSTYKMASYFKTKGEAYLDGGVVLGGFNPFLKIYYLTFVDDNETVLFADVDGHERWVGYIPDFTPEYYCKANNRFFSFINGKIYEHGVAGGTYGSFHGASAASCSIETVFNEDYSREKILRNLSIESNSADWDVPECTNVSGQETELEKAHFKRLNNVFYADWLRDKNTNPLLLKAGQLAIRGGKEMKAKSFDITLENDSTDKVQLEAINIGYLDASGHRII